MTTRSFGRPGPADTADDDRPQPVPVLHVGEVHAELRLTISDGTLRDLGSQIASMLATAAKQGFEHGMAAAMQEFDADDAPPAEFTAGSARLGRLITDDDARRARGE